MHETFAPNEDLDFSESMDFSENLDYSNESENEESDQNHQNTEAFININLVDFVKIKNEIFVELFAQVMKTKIIHSVANDAIDELLRAFLIASQKSNDVFIQKLKQAILSENSKWKLFKNTLISI